MNVNSQREAIGKHLLSGKALTALEALRKFNCLRLSGRIYDLKQEGMAIEKIMVRRGEKVVASYYHAA
jgi:hypothetical protein